MPRPLLLLLAAGVLAVAPGQAQTCSQLRTCAEAIKALQAGNRGLDRDGDGTPASRCARATGRLHPVEGARAAAAAALPY